uniref:Hikeshi-like domain-containing protein n=1 Tax=Chaetoceros debilis TaxID=122233 RepID=A0A7S3PTW8_9STRA
MSGPAAPPNSGAPPFGIIFPGKPVVTEFTPADASGTKFTLTIPFTCISSSSDSSHSSMSSTASFPDPTFNNKPDENSPSSVTDIVFFLLPNISLPPNKAAMIYWQASPLNPSTTNATPMSPQVINPSPGFELLGALTNQKTSAVFSTGWATHENLLALASNGQGISITLGVSIEPIETLQNLQHILSEKERGGVGQTQDRKHVAQKIATDLFNYLQSFDDGSGGMSGGSVGTTGSMVVPNNVFDRWYKRFEGKIARDPNFFMKSNID